MSAVYVDGDRLTIMQMRGGVALTQNTGTRSWALVDLDSDTSDPVPFATEEAARAALDRTAVTS